MRTPATERSSDKLLEQHRLPLWRYLCALSGSAELADDLCQETLLFALRRLEQRSEAETASFLRAVGRNLYLRTRRRMARRRESQVAEALDQIWARECAEDGGDAWLEATRACLDGLEGPGARAIHLQFFDGRPHQEIAATLALKPNGLKTLLQRTRARLRACIERRLGRST